jgi:DNA-binding LytR/AlgR family response regulator
MSYTVVIVDDEKPARERIRRLLAAAGDFRVVGEAADADVAVRVLDEQRPDVCFLDVRMPEGTGFDVLDEVAQVPRVVFTTAYDAYAVRAFEVRSIDFLLKPFSRKRFTETLARLRETLASRVVAGPDVDSLLDADPAAAAAPAAPAPTGGTAARISGRRGAKILLLDADEIDWFEAEDTLVFAHGAEGRLLVERTLVDLEAALAGRFFRCHRRFLVRVGAIREIVPGEAGTYRLVLRDEAATRLPLSRRQARRLREIVPW